jgi:alkanesulfonate monooxygenase SsuD/methylene tetrahydromethanopterin reductase-like flavin-dependent oxidoreductase (luciferase family)
MKVGIALIENYSFTLEPTSMGVKGIAAAARKREELGFDGILSPETAGHDPFFPLLIAAEHTTRVTLSTGIAVAFPRSPMVVAQMAWDLQRFSGGRFQLGLGTQVKGHNERRYGTPWLGAPGPRMREYVLCMQAIFKTFQNNKQPTVPRQNLICHNLSRRSIACAPDASGAPVDACRYRGNLAWSCDASPLQGHPLGASLPGALSTGAGAG